MFHSLKHIIVILPLVALHYLMSGETFLYSTAEMAFPGKLFFRGTHLASEYSVSALVSTAFETSYEKITENILMFMQKTHGKETRNLSFCKGQSNANRVFASVYRTFHHSLPDELLFAQLNDT